MIQFGGKGIAVVVALALAAPFGLDGQARADRGLDTSAPVVSGDVEAVGAYRARPAKVAASPDKLRGIVARHARAHGVPIALAKAVVHFESRWNPRARGRAGEIGLMQIKPQTARGLGFAGSAAALYDPETNIEWGMKYLAGAYRKAGGDLCGTILRYNAGHYAKRMNPVSARYCAKVRRHLSEQGITTARL